MSCKTQFSMKYLSENFEKKYIQKEYKEHIRNVLFEKELSLLQGTQVIVEQQIKKETKDIRKEISKLKTHLYEKEREQRKLIYNENNIIKEKRQFIRKCPYNDCKGFLSTALKCEICQNYSCKECREIKGKTEEEKNNHICNKEILESVKLLETD